MAAYMPPAYFIMGSASSVEPAGRERKMRQFSFVMSRYLHASDGLVDLVGSWSAGSWSGNQDLAWGGYDWSSVDLSAGKVTLVAEVEQDASAQWWQFMLKTGTSWADLAGMSQIDMVQGQTIVEVPLTQTMLDDLIANNGLIITGCNYTLKTLSLRIE